MAFLFQRCVSNAIEQNSLQSRLWIADLYIQRSTEYGLKRAKQKHHFRAWLVSKRGETILKLVIEPDTLDLVRGHDDHAPYYLRYFFLRFWGSVSEI